MKKGTQNPHHKCALCGRQLKDTGTEIAGAFFGPECATKAHAAAERLSKLGFTPGTTHKFPMQANNKDGFEYSPAAQEFTQNAAQYHVSLSRKVLAGEPPILTLTVTGASIVSYLRSQPLSFEDRQAKFEAQLKAQ